MNTMDYEEYSATLKLKQRIRNELMDNSFKIVKEPFREFLPTDIDRVRLIPGKEAHQLYIMTGLVYGEGKYMKARIEKWFRDWHWTRNYITDEEGQRTNDLSQVPDELHPYVLFDESGLLFYFTDGHHQPSLPPPYLQWDISGIRHFITTRLGIMSAAKNEELIASTLENLDPEAKVSAEPGPSPPEEVMTR